MAHHRVVLQPAQHALGLELLDDGLAELHARARAEPSGVHHAHGDEVARPLHVALEAVHLADARHARRELVGRGVQLQRARDGDGLALEALEVGGDLLAQAACLVELDRLLVQLQDLAALGHEVERRAHQRDHADQEQEQEERIEDPAAAARRGRGRRGKALFARGRSGPGPAGGGAACRRHPYACRVAADGGGVTGVSSLDDRWATGPSTS